MNTVLDILGSVIIGGLVFLMVSNLNMYSSTTKFASDSELRLQQSAKSLAEVVENDLRKIGYKNSGVSIINATQQKLTFLSDIDSTGTVDNVTLTVSDSTKLPNTQNPHDIIYYRIVNNDTLKCSSYGLTSLKFSYKNEFGYTTTNVDSIKYVKAEIWLQSPEKVDSSYAKTYWEITVSPRNI